MRARTFLVALSTLALLGGCGRGGGAKGGDTASGGGSNGGTSGDTTGGTGGSDTSGGTTGGTGDNTTGGTGGGSSGGGTGGGDTSGGGTNGGGSTGGGTPAAGTYDVIDLGTLGGGVSRALGIGSTGQVVGEAATAGGDLHAFLWVDGVMTDLGTLGGHESVAYGVSSSDVVVGSAQTASGAWHAFAWARGVMTDLGTLGTGSESFALGINDAGEIVGAADGWAGAYTGYSGRLFLHAMLWQFDGGTVVAQDLGTLGGGFGRAVAINEMGEIAGITYRLAGSGKVLSGAARWKAGVVTSLEPLPDGWASDAYAIDSAGDVVGASYVPQGSPPVRAVEWTDAAAAALGPLGSSDTAAFGIDDTGRIVGSAGAPPDIAGEWDGRYYGQTAVTWTAGAAAIALDTLLVDGAGWHLEVARAINDGGSIVGFGRHSGATRAFLLVPR